MQFDAPVYLIYLREACSWIDSHTGIDSLNLAVYSYNNYFDSTVSQPETGKGPTTVDGAVALLNDQGQVYVLNHDETEIHKFIAEYEGAHSTDVKRELHKAFRKNDALIKALANLKALEPSEPFKHVVLQNDFCFLDYALHVYDKHDNWCAVLSVDYLKNTSKHAEGIMYNVSNAFHTDKYRDFEHAKIALKMLANSTYKIRCSTPFIDEILDVNPLKDLY